MDTCDVQTLLNATNANVWANIVVARSLPINASGMTMPARTSCGTNAKDVMDHVCFGRAEDKYNVKW